MSEKKDAYEQRLDSGLFSEPGLPKFYHDPFSDPALVEVPLDRVELVRDQLDKNLRLPVSDENLPAPSIKSSCSTMPDTMDSTPPSVEFASWGHLPNSYSQLPSLVNTPKEKVGVLTWLRQKRDQIFKLFGLGNKWEDLNDQLAEQSLLDHSELNNEALFEKEDSYEIEGTASFEPGVSQLAMPAVEAPIQERYKKACSLKGWQIEESDPLRRAYLQLGLSENLISFVNTLFSDQCLSDFIRLFNQYGSLKEIRSEFIGLIKGQPALRLIYEQLNTKDKKMLFGPSSGVVVEGSGEDLSGAFLTIYSYGGALALKDFLTHPGPIVDCGSKNIVWKSGDYARKVPTLDFQGLLRLEQGNFLKRLEQEIEINEQLYSGHAFIVVDGLLAGVKSKFVPGGRNILEAMSFSAISDKVNCMSQLLSNVWDTLHQYDVVHRDIKPNNVMYNEEEGRPELIDFGLARPVSRVRTITGITKIIGTPTTMAPEQSKELVHSACLSINPDLAMQFNQMGYSTREPLSRHFADRLFSVGAESSKQCRLEMDVYSLGVVFYELLAGHWPFPVINRDDVEAIILARMQTYPKPIEGISNELQSVIMRALELDPDDRYKDAKEFREALLHVKKYDQ